MNGNPVDLYRISSAHIKIESPLSVLPGVRWIQIDLIPPEEASKDLHHQRWQIYNKGRYA